MLLNYYICHATFYVSLLLYTLKFCSLIASILFLRKEVKLCDDIIERSLKMENDLEQGKKLERKDGKKYEYKWRNG